MSKDSTKNISRYRMKRYPLYFYHKSFHDSVLIAHPVGDGNAIELQNWGTALMDCGGDSRAKRVLRSASARGMSEFLLTHLHADHYSGVTKQPTGTKLSTDVEHVFLPALPLIHDRELTMEFALALYTTNMILGNTSGIPEQDLIDRFKALNPLGIVPSHTFLSKGDSFDLAGTPFQVLWPPRAVSGLVAQSARNAVDAFNKAIKNDEHAMQICRRLKESASMAADRAYTYATDEGVGVDDATDSDDPSPYEGEIGNERDVPEYLREANRAIRGVANRLSLAFRCGSRLIHLGDLENAELNKVVSDLGGSTEFFGMIAAHHGTHFGHRMNGLYALNLVASNGKCRPKIDPRYDSIASYIQETNVHGHCFMVF